MRIRRDSDHIKVNGHIGKWYVVDYTIFRHNIVYLLEHESYGDMAACLIVDDEGNLILDDVWNGFRDLYESYGSE